MMACGEACLMTALSRVDMLESRRQAMPIAFRCSSTTPFFRQRRNFRRVVVSARKMSRAMLIGQDSRFEVELKRLPDLVSGENRGARAVSVSGRDGKCVGHLRQAAIGCDPFASPA